MASDDSVSDAMHRPSAETLPVEAIMSRNMVKRAVWVAPVLMIIFGVASGVSGAVAAGVGVAIVVVNFLIGGWIMSTAAAVSLTLYHAAALFGFFIRLGLITMAMLLIASVTDIDRTAMGVSAVVSYLTLLSLEAVSVVKSVEK
ncbi:MAG: hypothetical protein QGM46_10720 [Actinomycetota bacterium]|nr:hypothetical protein [Actinomycetota bacterium]MDK1017308.1 hypothetical protein [Actinomycetota bacterium]MDK1027189.1 hypothetical protein [Actinomycetota bacterium]MDK1039237.1 hypothetical protein [Actinomycetota bacterium]MDK1097648.1 hypothetical protein [Actinomycetota bacterium]